MWMYKTNQQRKKSREADIIISPTVKNENYYKELLNNENKNEDNKPNQSFNDYNNTQTSINKSFANNSFTSINEPTSPVSRILPESLTSPTSPTSPTSSNSFAQRSLSLNQNLANTSISNSIRSQSLNENNSVMANQMMRSSTMPASRNINRNQMTRSPTVSTPAMTTMDNQVTSSTSMEMAHSMISLAHNNNSQNITNPMLQGNMLQTPSTAFINPNISTNMINGVNLMNGINIMNGINNMNNQPAVAIYNMNIDVNNGMYNYSNFPSSSSSSIRNNNNINSNQNEINTQNYDDIKLKKKILQDKMNLKKFNMNQDNNQNDPDSNLPPYSEL
ncbi:hypothetical protein PIROE2DRAFT_60658 [Piromyces sp. E2]|nr:hypothetical protein PIROE2DRAFT_60658 [Piromyces sp. E2]|eukprot:OUM64456.1 hypothetical protein PIROE2DRAFT_60658 [Piromyces sp. E2]